LHGRGGSRVAGSAGPILMGDGEQAKHLRSVERIYRALAARRVDRGGMLAAFGGGVVGDVAGFAAATFLRGIDFIQIPTTLVAQVDSAIGGKVGVNLTAGKNLAGAFHAPALVLVDPVCCARCRRANSAPGCTKSSSTASSRHGRSSTGSPDRSTRSMPRTHAS
jgi:3-dehydroquinate synthetase